MSSPNSDIDLEEEEVDYENMSINSDVEEGGDAAYVSSNSDIDMEEEEVASEYEYDASSDDEGGAFQFQLPYQSLYNREAISCLICCEEKIEEGCGLILPNCRHSLCIKCFNKHIEMVVGQGNADNIKCPFNIEGGDGDDNMIGHSQCCNEAVAMDILREVLDEESFKRLMCQKNAAFVLKNPDYHHCPTPDCSGIVLCPFVDTTVNNSDSGDALGHELPSVSAAAAPPRICDCFRCGKTSCLSCGASPFHEGLTCAQYQHQRELQQQNKAANIIRDAYLQYRRRAAAAAAAADPTEELLQRRRFVSEMRRRFRMRFSTFDRSRDREETKYEFELDTTEATMLGITSTSTPKEKEVGFFSTIERTILGNDSFSTIKRCRRCGNGIERVSGCLHMTCRCGYEFCFKCGSDLHYACTE